MRKSSGGISCDGLFGVHMYGTQIKSAGTNLQDSLESKQGTRTPSSDSYGAHWRRLIIGGVFEFGHMLVLGWGSSCTVGKGWKSLCFNACWCVLNWTYHGNGRESDPRRQEFRSISRRWADPRNKHKPSIITSTRIISADNWRKEASIYTYIALKCPSSMTRESVLLWTLRKAELASKFALLLASGFSILWSSSKWRCHSL